MANDKAKGIAWFRSHNQYRAGGKLHVIRYFQVCDNGNIQVLDVSRNYLANQRSFGGLPVSITTSTKEEWTINVNRLVSNFKQTL